MFQLNRKVEYALAIVAFMARRQGGELHSARSIAEATHIPFDMVTKCLQRLHKGSMCEAVQGKHGGYRLTMDLDKQSLGDFICAVFAPIAVADCIAKEGQSDCQLLCECELRDAMSKLNDRIQALLDDMSLAEFLSGSSQPVTEA
ncbi:MAG: Rrf2 family transcriptional regulator [Planctomycetota bacterium]|jgi:Rrf2 family protein|nr:Rrf2 family transcriptional regulator [Planctomycetota bacterium]